MDLHMTFISLFFPSFVKFDFLLYASKSPHALSLWTHAFTT